VAAAITKTTGHDVDLIKGARGIFEVRVGAEIVATKTAGRFPEVADCVSAVQEALP
jgi:hypothetical protein